METPEVDTDDETTAEKLMKDYSDEESSDDPEYVTSEASKYSNFELEYDSDTSFSKDEHEHGVTENLVGSGEDEDDDGSQEDDDWTDEDL